jgi:hypothetical protein
VSEKNSICLKMLQTHTGRGGKTNVLVIDLDNYLSSCY